MPDLPSPPPWYGQVDCQTEDALLAASRAYLLAHLPPPEWLRPLPPLEPYQPEHNASCDLGEYIEYPDGTLEALPAEHGLGNTVAYAMHPDAVWSFSPGLVPLPVRRVGTGYLPGMVRAPQPAPRYSRLHRGAQIRTGAPE